MSSEETTFDNSCILTFDKVYKAFVKDEENLDVFEHMSRSEYRCKYSNMIKENKDLALAKLSALKAKPKSVEENNLSVPIEDPFTLLGYDEKTDIQQKIEKHTDWMKFYGNYAYSCSCGAGKTVAGIYVMYKKQCKTLIISSRNAVNDQWMVLIQQLYPELVIETREGKFRRGAKASKRLDSDVYIFSPQYLKNKLDLDINPSLIIYDEVHSLLSKQFIKVLLFPMNNVINKRWKELPYMIALSATYPSNSTWRGKEANNRINKIFGSVFKSPSNITSIPVKFWDYRDHYEYIRNDDGVKLVGDEARGSFDSRYRALDDYEGVRYFCEKVVEGVEEIAPIQICPEYKGLIMTYSIDSSVYAALYAHKLWNCNVVLVRAADEACLLFEKDKKLDFEFNEDITLEDVIREGVGVRCDYVDVVDECCVVVGTLHRLKEGFSIQNITWGICTKFVYNTIPRVQILGRIRRNSDNEALNKHERAFYVCSGGVPNTLGIPNYKGKHRITYDFKSETQIFRAENYVRV